jgi:phage tail-like protein
VADPNLLRAFRFRVTLVKSAEGGPAVSGGGGGGGGGGAGAFAGASLSAGASAGFGASAGASAGASLGASASFGAAAGIGGAIGAGAGVSAGIGVSASAGASFGAGASIGAGAPGGGAVLGNAAFAECSGLDIEMDVQDYLEGGRNDAVVRRAGRAKYHPLILKRGMVYPRGGGVDGALWTWMQDVTAGVRPITRYDGIVEVMSVADTVSARWVFTRGLPSKIAGPQLNARTGEIAIEELTIAHEGLKLVPA